MVAAKEAVATISFPVEAGVLMRRPIRRDLKAYCFAKGLKLTIDEDRGLLNSLFLVRIEVPSDQFSKVSVDLNTWAKEISG